MKKGYLLLSFIFLCMIASAQPRMQHSVEGLEEAFIIEIYLCSEDDKLVWEDIKKKATELGAEFSDQKEVEGEEGNCIVETMTCPSKEECGEIMVELDGKKIKIRSGLHSEDFTKTLFSQFIFKIRNQKGLKIFQVLDRKSKQIVYERKLFGVLPSVYSGTVVSMRPFNDQVLVMYDRKASLKNRNALIKSIFDRQSISMVFRKK